VGGREGRARLPAADSDQHLAVASFVLLNVLLVSMFSWFDSPPFPSSSSTSSFSSLPSLPLSHSSLMEPSKTEQNKADSLFVGTSAPLQSVGYHFGEFCKTASEDFVRCKEASAQPAACAEAGTKVTQCAVDLYASKCFSLYLSLGAEWGKPCWEDLISEMILLLGSGRCALFHCVIDCLVIWRIEWLIGCTAGLMDSRKRREREGNLEKKNKKGNWSRDLAIFFLLFFLSILSLFRREINW